MALDAAHLKLHSQRAGLLLQLLHVFLPAPQSSADEEQRHIRIQETRFLPNRKNRSNILTVFENLSDPKHDGKQPLL